MKRLDHNDGIKGQEVVREVKSSETISTSEEPPKSSPELNPFLVEPILVRLLKLVDSVSQLKELRKMCQTWDEFNLKELEDRAFNGKIKPINFYYGKNYNFYTKPTVEANLVRFMEDTLTIPRLFSSLEFSFPELWSAFENHMGFFSIYPVTFAHVGIPSYLDEYAQVKILFRRFMETETWRNLKEITISKIDSFSEFREYGFPPSSLFPLDSENMVRKLQKLNISTDSPTVLDLFESAFASGKYTNLRDLILFKLPSGNLDFPGLDLFKLTHLEVKRIEHSEASLKFTSCLINLAGKGMKLKKFGFGFVLTPQKVLDLNLDANFFDNLPLICTNLAQFLSSQSSTLETLAFKFICFMKDPKEDVPENPAIWCKIHLPTFEVLHSLRLKVDFQLLEASPEIIHTKIFGMTQNLALHFPKLANLTLINESSLDALRVNPAPDEPGQLQLKCLKIVDHSIDFCIWQMRTPFVGVVGSVEELECPTHLLLEELPWEESLRQLYINDLRFDSFNKQQRQLKLNQYKKLERLLAVHYNSNTMIYTRQRHVRGLDRWWKHDENYLNMFKEAIELPLKSITFIGRFYNMSMREKSTEKFIQYFPFPVEFKVDN